ncbi:MAG TPA: tRNA preQ1(34) S-adenosylmethionine ribosyltransferase-isomerase QueA [bacterium]|nr:tRNA preQ1(34) S-adenosylmethionine ribosyltransferase-isomerase QueA [bacterium]HOL47636.1 tRNA preQ1(34) S-adenosylmethionine ribosyltransferase-isomerase QueA [bacterium]HPQ19652.1 tRNA preQ1(34) S-adenosylmethionine ribosyltransferase-isomerase QueA [bacterium]
MNEFSNIKIPEELIAQTPIENRSKSRLLYLNKETGIIKHYIFEDIVNLLTDKDVLVINNSRVIKARLNFEYKNKKCELMLAAEQEKNIWDCIVYPGKYFKIGTRIKILNNIEIEVLDRTDYGRLIRFNCDRDIKEIYEKYGKIPLPPYIKKELNNSERYQTVFSKEIGSIAAPTAGLHFTDELLSKLKDKGVDIFEITLHIGPGTFCPIKNIQTHKMHSEYVIITEKTAQKINEAISAKKKIVAVGTTSVRALESAALKEKIISQFDGWTDLFIKFDYKFKIVDKLITNFHLPHSTLIVLTSAFAGIENIKKAYQIAIAEKYKFFSFGDAMFIE